LAKVSIRLVRSALFASAASLATSYACPTLAQVPIYQPPPEPEPEPGVPAAPDAAPPPAGGVSSAPAAPPPALAPAAPAATPTPAPARSPGLLSSRTPPARTDVITEPRAPVAEESEDDDSDDPLGPRRKWYGWQTLTADGASFGLLTMAAVFSNEAGDHDSDATALAWFGLLGYELAPGIIHFVHKNPGRGFASMGLRLGMPLTGAILGASFASGCSGFGCEEGGAALGLLLGMGGAIAIDSAVFAYDDQRRPRPGLSVTPLVSLTRRQAWVGFGGQL
jgi:hypothetical protein